MSTERKRVGVGGKADSCRVEKEEHYFDSTKVRKEYSNMRTNVQLLNKIHP